MNRKQSVLIVISLALSLSISIFIRIQNLPSLEGQYPLDNDSARFLRQAKIIAADGRLPDMDMMRWLPLGRDLTRQLSLSSYVIAYMYKFIRLIIPAITVEQTAIYYPIICFSISLFIFFLLIDRLFDGYTAFISTIFLAIFPPLIARSMAGYSDRDSFCMLLSFLAFYLFVRSLQTYEKHYRFVFAFASGAVMALFGLTWEGSSLFIAVIVLFHLVKFVTNADYREDFHAYLIWCLPILSGILIFTKTYRTWLPFAVLAWGIPGFVLMIALLGFIFSRSQRLISFVTLKSRLSFGLSVFILMILVCLFSLAIVFAVQPVFITGKLLAIKDNFLTPLGQSRLMRSLGELQRPYSIDWAIRYGAFLVLFSAGAILYIRKLALSLHLNQWFSMTSFEVLLMGIFFSRFSLSLPSNRDSVLSAAIYIGSLLLFLLMVMGLCLYRQKSSHIQEWQSRGIPENALFSLIWFTLLLLPARGAERYGFFFAPIGIAFGCYAILQLLKAGQQRLKRRTLRMLLHVSVAAAIIMVLISYCRISYSIAKTTHPHISQSRKNAYVWMKNNSSEEAVVASWWDYGSWINTLAERATIVDEDHYIPYWIHLMARHVMVGQTEIEALEFLKAHNATHLIIGIEDIMMLPAISNLGSDENFDRRSYIPKFISRREDIDASSEAITLRYNQLNGKAIVNDVLQLNDKIYERKSWSVTNVYLNLVRDGKKSWELKGVVLEVNIGGKVIRLPPQEIYFRGKSIKNIKDETLPCTIIIHSSTSNPLNWDVLFLSETVRRALMIRLHLLNKGSDFFVPVYPTRDQKRESQVVDYSVRIWKINYPQSVSTKPKYLEMEFSDPKLHRSWVQGKE